MPRSMMLEKPRRDAGDARWCASEGVIERGLGLTFWYPRAMRSSSARGESFGSAVSAAACVSLMPCMSKAREGVMGERAFAKSRNGDERSAAWWMERIGMGQDGNGIGNRAR